MSARNMEFVGRVLDNVHGFIYYTRAEERIMNTLYLNACRVLNN